MPAIGSTRRVERLRDDGNVRVATVDVCAALSLAARLPAEAGVRVGQHRLTIEADMIKVLVVDDDQDVRALLNVWLRGSEFQLVFGGGWLPGRPDRADATT